MKPVTAYHSNTDDFTTITYRALPPRAMPPATTMIIDRSDGKPSGPSEAARTPIAGGAAFPLAEPALICYGWRRNKEIPAACEQSHGDDLK
ncbi:MAG: hypothetical protein AUK55_08205 [Syntrophobacteraceae bacterium CG2_30_61_12]|nr:MAG: hypothetical protein AUK55_08205 [Syntrophobacteraceae bacterium CG2_30_61_12]